ncbi:MAG: NAD-dependent epimerase/dehydratase family protein [Paracoccaceae bacterium]
MTILVTGGTGLVGSRLLRRLADAGIDCRALVRSGKGLPAGVTPVEGDILDPATLGSAVKGISAIVHLAAVLRTPDPDEIWRANLDGTRNLIAAMQQHSPQARFIMASTGLVYNEDSPHPGREEDAVDPKLAYPASKVAAEAILRDSGLTWSILRFGFVYGDKDGHIESLPGLVERFKLHPASKLSVIHHRDIATFVTLALSGALDGQIVNTVDEAPMSVYELCELVGAQIKPSSAPLSNPWWGQMDGSLARRLGFQPTVSTVYQAAREDAL